MGGSGRRVGQPLALLRQAHEQWRRLEARAVARGVAWLQKTQGADGVWRESRFTATGFPRVFYLRYHGYSKFFPLWALARFRNLKRANSRRTAFGL